MEKRNIELPNGQVLEIEMTERFCEAIRFEYKMEPFARVSDEQVKTFIYGAMKNAVDKAERELNS